MTHNRRRIYDTLPAERLIAMRSAGATLAQIGQQFRVSVYTVRRALDAAGWKDPPTLCHAHTPQAVKDEACRLYASGMTGLQVAAVVGRSGTAVLDWVRAAGLTRRRFYGGPGSNFGLSEEVLLDHLDAGHTYQQIADAHGCHIMTVLYACRYHGIRLGKGYWMRRARAEKDEAGKAAIRAAVVRVREQLKPPPVVVPEWPECPAWLADVVGVR